MLLAAVCNNDMKTVRALLKSGADVNCIDNERCTPLHRAAEDGRYGITKLLLKHGADVHVCDKDGETPLHKVAQGYKQDHVKIAQLLLEHGADVSSHNCWGEIPLYCAICMRYNQPPKLAKLLAANMIQEAWLRFRPRARASAP